MKKYLFLTPILFLFLFFGTNKASASVVLHQDSTSDANVISGESIGFIQSHIIGNKGTLKAITISGITRNSGNCAGTYTGHVYSGSNHMASGEFDIGASSMRFTFDYAHDPVVINDIIFFTFDFHVSSGYCNPRDTEFTLQGHNGNYDSANFYLVGYNNFEPYIQVENTIADPTISWDNPPFASTFTTPDFKLWKVCISIPSNSNISAFYVLFMYGEGNVSDHQEQSYNTETNNGSPGEYDKCAYFPKSTDLTTPGNYQAKADLYNTDTDGLLAQSTAIYFQIIVGDQGDYPAVISTPPTQIQCNQSNIIARGFCDVLTYLFIPSGLDETQTFADTQSLFQNKAPFAYFYELKSSFSGVSTAASSGYFINTTLTSKDKNGNVLASIPFQFLNTADTNTKGVFDDFRVYISAALWFGFAVYLLTRAYRFFRPV